MGLPPGGDSVHCMIGVHEPIKAGGLALSTGVHAEGVHRRCTGTGVHAEGVHWRALGTGVHSFGVHLLALCTNLHYRRYMSRSMHYAIFLKFSSRATRAV